MINDDENSMDVDEIQVRLQTNDGKRFTLSKSEALCSNALRMIVESNRVETNPQCEYISLQNVNSRMLTKVLEWCRKHPDTDSFPETGIDTTDWDKAFFRSMKSDELLKLIHAANYLDVRSLFDSSCRVIAKQWEGLKVEEIRKLYGIECDLSADEDHQMFLESKKLGMDN